MRVLITGACGFVGSTLVEAWSASGAAHEIVGMDNFVRAGSERNRQALTRRGVQLFHGDLRSSSDVDALPSVDWVIDAAANPSVLAGVDGRNTSRQVIEHNLLGTINVLEYCRRHSAGFILLSTSRVYSLNRLSTIPVKRGEDAFVPDPDAVVDGLSPNGIDETFSTEPPLSLYGASKRASEQLALEYGDAFEFPVWVNRCGVLAGPGQFGRGDQGIFSYWIHSWRERCPLHYIGFGGQGLQVRDCLHPRDLVPLLDQQMSTSDTSGKPRVINVSGGLASATSLLQLSTWCEGRFGEHRVDAAPDGRRYDVPWLVLDSSTASGIWNWTPATPAHAIFEEIARHAEVNPTWLDITR